MPAIRDELTQEEKREWRQCCAALRRYEKASFDAGEALWKVRTQRLYRAKYPTFEVCCQMEWGYSNTYASRLINSHRTREAIRGSGSHLLPESVNACKALLGGLIGPVRGRGGDSISVGSDGLFVPSVASEIVSRWNRALSAGGGSPNTTIIQSTLSKNGEFTARFAASNTATRLVSDRRESARRVVALWDYNEVNEFIQFVAEENTQRLQVAA